MPSKKYNARERQIREWFIEFKVAAQFSKSWDDVEEMATAEFIQKGMEPPPPADDTEKRYDDKTWRQTSRDRISSAHYWMQQVDVPRWFKFDELGIGTATSIYRTLETLQADNLRRLEHHDRLLRGLKRAHKNKAA